MSYLLADPVRSSEDTQNGQRMLHRQRVELVAAPVKLVDDVVNKASFAKPAIWADHFRHASQSRCISALTTPKPVSFGLNEAQDCCAAHLTDALQQPQVQVWYVHVPKAQSHADLNDAKAVRVL